MVFEGVQVVSDIHLPQRSRCSADFVIPVKARYLVLAGDIGSVWGSGMPQVIRFLHGLGGFERVFYVPGNHEFYGTRHEEALRVLDDICRAMPNVVLAEKGAFDLPQGYRLLGTTLWSRVTKSAAACVNDFAMISTTQDGYARRIMPRDVVAWHEESVAWLEAELLRAHADGVKALVATHHAPILNSNPLYVDRPQNAAFETDLSALWRDSSVAPRAWFFGHTHYCHESTVGGVLMRSNQMGYPDEIRGNFDPAYVYPLV